MRVSARGIRHVLRWFHADPVVLKVQYPMLVLWGSKGRIGKWYDALTIWRQYCAAEVTGGPVEAGHYIAEEAPAAALGWFGKFFG
jgi:haloacetate dehalogenase